MPTRAATWIVVMGLAVPAAGQPGSPYVQTTLLSTPRPLPRVGPAAELREILAARLNAPARIVLLGRYARTGTAASLSTGLFELAGAELTPLLLEQQQTALGGSTVYTDLRQLLLNDAGTIALGARRVEGAAGRNVALRIAGTTIAALDGEGPAGLNNRGEAVVADAAGLRGWSAAGVRTVAKPGDPAPGTGSIWMRLTGAALNDAGQVVFTGEYSRRGAAAGGVWLADGQDVQLLAKYGDLVPGLYPETLLSFSNPALSESGTVAFTAQTTGRVPGLPSGFNSLGVFVWSQGTISSVGPSGFVFSAAETLSYPSAPRPVFDADSRLYWSGQVGGAPAILRWPADSGLEPKLAVFARSSLSLSPSRSGLMLLAGPERIDLVSTLALTNAATPDRPTAALAEGSIATLYAAGAGEAVPLAATRLPLPLRLGGSEVIVGGRAAPLFYAGGDQVNFQAPAGLTGNSLVRALHNGAVRALGLIIPQPDPGLFPVATNQDGSLNHPANAAERGSAITLYGTGARVYPAPTDGDAAPRSGQPLFYTSTTPTAWAGSVRAQVLFSGLAPGLVGVWQVNLMVPAAAPAGSAVPVRLLYDGIETNTITVAVR